MKNEYKSIILYPFAALLACMLLVFAGTYLFKKYKAQGEIWSKVFPVMIIEMLKPLEDGSILQFVSDRKAENFLRKIAPLSGDVIWRQELPYFEKKPGRYSDASPYLVQGNHFLYFNRDGKYLQLFSVELKTGKILFNESKQLISPEDKIIFFQADEKRIYIGTESRPRYSIKETGIMVISPGTGKTYWKLSSWKQADAFGKYTWETSGKQIMVKEPEGTATFT